MGSRPRPLFLPVASPGGRLPARKGLRPPRPPPPPPHCSPARSHACSHSRTSSAPQGALGPRPPPPLHFAGIVRGLGGNVGGGRTPKVPPPPKTPLSAGPPTARAGRTAMDGTKGFPGMGGTGGTEAPTDPPPNPAPSLAPPTPLPSPLPPGTHLSDRVPPSSCAPPTCAAPPCSILALTCPHDSPSPGCYVPTVFQPYASPPHNTAPLPHPVPAAPHSPIGSHHHPASPHLSIPAVPVPVAALSP